MKVLGLIDSFKGTLTSLELGEILKKELKKKNIICDYIPISDGGDGFIDVLETIVDSKRIYLDSFNSLMGHIRTYYLYEETTNTAYIELAKTSGLDLIKKSKLNPFITSTYGTGIVILDSINRGIKTIVVGLGGSSTNDGGSGMLDALGVKFFDENFKKIEYLCNLNLSKIKNFDLTAFNKILADTKIIVVSDVDSPLLGIKGATYSFAVQKGAKESDLKYLDANLEYYANLLESKIPGKFKNSPGSGAAGGVGFALYKFFSSYFVSGIDYILDLIDFNNLVNNYDYIITGEGKIDEQSLAGKVVFEVLKRSNNKKVVFLSAINELDLNFLKSKNVFKSYAIVNKITTVEKSLKYPKRYFKKLVREIDI